MKTTASIVAAVLAIAACGGGDVQDANAPIDAVANDTNAHDAISTDVGFDASVTDALTNDVMFDDVSGHDTGPAPSALIVFQCAGLGGGICTMNADGTDRRMLVATGHNPDRNTAGDILFHDDSYNVQLRRADGSTTSLGAGAFAQWSAAGGILFQCAGLGGGICTMNADGSSRMTITASGRSPDRNAAGEILFHDDSYNVQLRHADGTTTSLGAGAFARWTATGGILFQCSGLGGGICTMNADGSSRQTVSTTGRTPDGNTSGDILFHDDSYTVQLRHSDGTVTALGAGAFARW